MDIIELIMQCAAVPSFSTFEDQLHPLIKSIVGTMSIASLEMVPDHNLIITVPGNRKSPPIALAAHLDKINHFGLNFPTPIPVSRDSEGLEGLLDDAVGVGIGLGLMLESQRRNFPPLLLLLSEVEENISRVPDRRLLRQNSHGLHSGIGARRIAEYLLEQNRVPSLVITPDTTPLFKGQRGLALYSRPWEFGSVSPSEELVAATQAVEKYMQRIHPSIRICNNTNDYVIYGTVLNSASSPPVPSLALEPAIYPYHQTNERVYLSDIETVIGVLRFFLETFPGVLGSARFSGYTH